MAQPMTGEVLDRCTLEEDIKNLTSRGEGPAALFGATSLARKLGSGKISCANLLVKRNGGKAIVAALRALPRDCGEIYIRYLDTG